MVNPLKRVTLFLDSVEVLNADISRLSTSKDLTTIIGVEVTREEVLTICSYDMKLFIA